MTSGVFRGGALCDAPLCADGIFFSANFSQCELQTTCEKSNLLIHTLAMDGLWRNFEVGKAFEIACMSVHIGRAIVMALTVMRGKSLVGND
jgi:hypothetical protein